MATVATACSGGSSGAMPAPSDAGASSSGASPTKPSDDERECRAGDRDCKPTTIGEVDGYVRTIFPGRDGLWLQVTTATEPFSNHCSSQRGRLGAVVWLDASRGALSTVLKALDTPPPLRSGAFEDGGMIAGFARTPRTDGGLLIGVHYCDTHPVMFRIEPAGKSAESIDMGYFVQMVGETRGELYRTVDDGPGLWDSSTVRDRDCLENIAFTDDTAFIACGGRIARWRDSQLGRNLPRVALGPDAALSDGALLLRDFIATDSELFYVNGGRLVRYDLGANEESVVNDDVPEHAGLAVDVSSGQPKRVYFAGGYVPGEERKLARGDVGYIDVASGDKTVFASDGVGSVVVFGGYAYWGTADRTLARIRVDARGSVALAE